MPAPSRDVPAAPARALLAALLLSFSACGYHLAGEAGDPLGPFRVEGSAARVPHVEAIAAAEEGARAELARAGALAPGAESRSAIVVEILRVDETAEGITASPSVDGAFPLARGTTISVVGRASVRRGAIVERETGDMRAGDSIARAPEAAASLVQRREAIRRAARLLGERLA
ncbi:MAG: hypothetical protein ABI193_08825, partial [Minicystis sp.]